MLSHLVAGAFACFALCSHAQSIAPAPYSSSLIYQAPNGTALENLVVRDNGLILTTDSAQPELRLVDPQAGTSQLVHTFSNATGLLGITEAGKDVFYVVVGNFSLKDLNAPNTWSIWTVNYNSGPNPVISKNQDVTGARLLNGLTTFDARRGLLFVADSVAGAVVRIDVEQRTNKVISQGPLFSGNPIGINGLHVRDQKIYYSNTYSDGGFLGSLPIDKDGYSVGNASKVASGGVDDFTFDGEGNIFAATNAVGNSVVEYHAPNYANEDKLVTLSVPTAAQFGRCENDKGCLYVTTSGFLADSSTHAGALYVVDITGSGRCPQPHR